MALFLVTAPAYEPISLNEAKLHCRVDVTTDDALIASLILAAREYVENQTHRALIQQTWDLKLDRFPCGPIELPKAPTQSVTSVTYLDGAGDSQTWDTDEYSTDLPSGPQAARARIQPANSYTYPQTYDEVNAVTVRFVAGYSGSTKAVTSITRSSSTATVTTTAAHGFSTGQRIVHAGAVQPEYNGTFEITVTAATTYTFTVTGSPATPATGTITAALLNVPASLIAAMKLMIGHWYERRESVNVGNIVNEIPMGVPALVWPYKAF